MIPLRRTVYGAPEAHLWDQIVSLRTAGIFSHLCTEFNPLWDARTALGIMPSREQRLRGAEQ